MTVETSGTRVAGPPHAAHGAPRRSHDVTWQPVEIDGAARARALGQCGCVVWLTGLSGAGKSTIADLVEQRLHALRHHTYLLDGDNVRHGLTRDLGFSDADRTENIRRVGEVAALMVDAGLIVLAAFIAPFRSERLAARALVPDGRFVEVFVDTPLEVAEARDPKGLYAKARSGRLPGFTGIDSDYEPPERAEIRIDTTVTSAQEAAERIVAQLRERGLLRTEGGGTDRRAAAGAGTAAHRRRGSGRPSAAGGSRRGGDDVSTDTIIRLDDLRDPRLSPDQRRLLDEAERNPVVLSVDAVVRAGREQAGLRDLGAEDFEDRLAAILAEIDADDNATAFVRRSVFGRAIGHLVNRLRLVDLLRRHPEIHEVEIERPIVIAGLPRSGTTHLLNLMSADRRLQSLPYWLAIEPVPDPEEQAGEDGADPRIARAERRWEQTQVVNPTMAAYHPMPAGHIHEDVELQMPDFSTYIWEWWTRVPRWRDRYLATDQTASYEFGRTVLKAIQWQRGTTGRWVLKAPQHFEQLPAIMRTYPDATVVFTHRDPVASLQSIVTQLAYRTRMREKRVDPDWHMAYWTDRVQRLLGAYVRDRDVVPPAQRFDVHFDRFMEDDVAMVERIHGAAALPTTATAREQLTQFMAEHPRGKHGRIDHDLRRDFGADPDALWASFSRYTDLLGLRREVR